MTMILDILNEAMRNNTFVGIWTYDDENSFWSGKIKGVNHKFVTIEHYSKFGKYDGVVIEQIENIESIDFKDGYSEAMTYLSENHHKLDEIPQEEIYVPTTEDWQYELLKKYEGRRNVIVNIELNEDKSFFGFVDQCNEESTVLNCIGSEGHDEFYTVYKNEDISTVHINSLQGRKRLLLYNWRKNRQ